MKIDNDFKREINFLPCSKLKGDTHGVYIYFTLIRGNTAVEFAIDTNWDLQSEVERKLKSRKLDEDYVRINFLPFPFFVSYHSPVPLYNRQKSLDNKCSFTGGDCYYDCSHLLARDLYNVLLLEGGNKMWEKLENYWHETFDEVINGRPN